MALIVTEWVLGGWLLTGIYPTVSRYVAIACFSALLAASVGNIMAGEVSCGCFGKLATTPWATAALDLTLVATLIALPTPPQSSPLRRTVAAAMMMAVAAAFALWLINRPPIAEPVLVTPRAVQFGQVRRAEARQADLLFTNQTVDDIEVTEVTSTCPCLSVMLSLARIRPGESVPARVVLDLSREPAFTGRLAIRANGIALGRPVFQIAVFVTVVE